MSKLHTKDLSEEVRLCNLPTLRQTFIIASTIIILGYLLGRYVHPGFMVLPIVVAGGLMFSGVVGFCPMVHIIQKMPWNRKSK